MHHHPSQKLDTSKRQRLFQVSSTEFAAHGFTQASLNRIISEVGMSKSSFYHYFKNKTDLFLQTIDQAMGPVLESHVTIDIDALTAENLWPSLLQMGGELIETFNNSPELIEVTRMFYRCMDAPDECELIAPYMQAFTGWLSQIIRRGQALGKFRTDLPESLLIDVLMAMGMSIDRWMLARWDDFSQTERLKVSHNTFDLFVQMLTPKALAQ
jgi:AcrR family transcriptional regulator